MSQSKKGYFQGAGGVNEPTPKKNKYKPEKAQKVQTRFEEPFYKNYDLYDHGPGTGVYNNKEKSVKDFLKTKKKLKNKYKEKSSRAVRLGKIKIRTDLINKIIKSAMDFRTDESVNNPIIGNSGAYKDSVGIGGNLDEYLPLNDFEGHLPTELIFGREHAEEISNYKKYIIKKLLEKMLNPKETELLGLPNGFEPEEDLDSSMTTNEINTYYGNTDSGNTLYDNMWI
jgi:hypothetical protein